jgi:pimeloyl-ACP methyl ester carboxylesterase
MREEHAMASPKPFTLTVDDAVLQDLRRRLEHVRWPGEPANAGWRYGANLDYMRRLIVYWREQFDWRAAEARINAFPQFTAPVVGNDGTPLDLHFIREEGSGDKPLPLLLLHGWPGSIAEFLDIIEPLAHPERFGGDETDAFTVIAPSLPGYGFSQAPPAPIGPIAMAGIMSRLMTDVLGYESYVVQGGDWGSIIAARIAADFPTGLNALHVNMTPLRPHLDKDSTPLIQDEKAWIELARQRRVSETAYQDIQATKSQSLAYGLTDSPAGLAGWITEKFHVWSDGTADEPPFTMDQLLTNIMIYWVSGCMNSATWLYRGLRDENAIALAPGQRIGQPFGFCLPPNDLVPPPPDSWLRRLGNVKSITRLDSGGHFTALEKGPQLIADMRAFFRAHAR